MDALAYLDLGYGYNILALNLGKENKSSQYSPKLILFRQLNRLKVQSVRKMNRSTLDIYIMDRQNAKGIKMLSFLLDYWSCQKEFIA